MNHRVGISLYAKEGAAQSYSRGITSLTASWTPKYIKDFKVHRLKHPDLRISFIVGFKKISIVYLYPTTNNFKIFSTCTVRGKEKLSISIRSHIHLELAVVSMVYIFIVSVSL